MRPPWAFTRQLAECQPDPGALGTLTIAPHVEVEDGRMLLRRDSGPVVGDGEPIGFGVGNYVQPISPPS